MNQRRVKDLAPLLRPRSIAIVGCSPLASGKLGSWPLRNLLSHKAPVEIFPVNPGYDEIEGLRCYPDLASLPSAPDLVLVMVAASGALPVLEAAEAVGARGAIVLSSGFGETATGREREEELRAFTRRAAMPVCGPNTDGIINLVDRIPSGFPPFAAIPDLPAGTVGVVSQSGALVSSLVMRLLRHGSGPAYSCAVGNAVDLGVGDYIRHFADDEHVESILVYVEGIADRRAFLSGADRAIRAGKPVAVLKAGRSAEGGAAAASHTGAMVGSYDAFTALCQRHGIVVADDLAELAAIPGLLPLVRRIPHAHTVGIVAGSGAAGALITDKAREHGFAVPELTAGTVDRLADRLHYGVPRNPFDLTGQVVHDPQLHPDALAAFADDPGLDLLVVSSLYGPAEFTDQMKREVVAASRAGVPIAVFAVDGNEPVDEPILGEAGVPVLPSLDVLFRSFRALGRSLTTRETRPPDPSPARAEALALLADLPSGPVPPRVAWRLLDLYGVPTASEQVIHTPEEAVGLADAWRCPVAAKLTGASLTHKSDRGLVRLSLADEAAVAAAVADLTAVRDAEEPDAEVVLQPMVAGGIEMIVGIRTDPEAGPVVLVGTGGVLTEILDDLALAPAPLDPTAAADLLTRIRGSRMLDGPRGTPVMNRDALIDIVVAVSRLAADLEGVLAELEINPVIVLPDGATAVDVLATRRASPSSRP